MTEKAGRWKVMEWLRMKERTKCSCTDKSYHSDTLWNTSLISLLRSIMGIWF